MRRGSQDEEEKQQNKNNNNIHNKFSNTIAALIRGVLSSQKSGFARHK
jgi:hypothetical protein